jgi:hypothetical protein
MPSGEKVEGAADTDRHRHRQAATVEGDPEVLLGVAEGDQEDVGPGVVEPVDDLVIRHASQRQEGRLEGAGDDQARVASHQLSACLRGNAVRAPQEEDPSPSALRQRGDLGNQVGARDPAREAAAE